MDDGTRRILRPSTMAQRKDASVPACSTSPFLPPELKLKIVETLPLHDLKALRLADRAWSDAATIELEKTATLSLNCDCLLHLLGEEEVGSFGRGFKSFRLQTCCRGFNHLPFYKDKVILALTTRVTGGGAAVERLTFGPVSVSGCAAKDMGHFLSQMFSICVNLKEIAAHNSKLFFINDLTFPFPVLGHCKTLRWYNSHRLSPPSQLFMNAKPQLTTVVNPREYIINALNAHPHLWKDVTVVRYERTPLYTASPNNLSDLNRQLTVLSLKGMRLDAHIALPLLLKIWSQSLQVLEMEDCAYKDLRSWTWKTRATDPPVMMRLHTLSVVNCDPGGFAFGGLGLMFGAVLNRSFQRPMRLDTNFPALTTLRFTVKEEDVTKPYIFMMNYLPLLLQDNPDTDSGSLSVQTLELNWPDPEKDPYLWKDWTRRVVTKFPNVEGNTHIHKWNALREELGEIRGYDGVSQEWQNYYRVHVEAIRQRPRPKKPIMRW